MERFDDQYYGAQITALKADNAVLRGIVQRYRDGWLPSIGKTSYWYIRNTIKREPMSPAERAILKEDHQ